MRKRRSRMVAALALAALLCERAVADDEVWRPSLPNAGLITALAFAADGKTLYAAAGYRGATAPDPPGVYRLDPVSGHWTRVGPGPAERQVIGLTCDPGPPETLWAATNIGLFRSIDGGASWEAAGTGLPMTYAKRITRAADATLYASTNDGIFKSTDHGKSWSVISDEAMGASNLLAIDPTNPAILYAGDLRGGFKSEDGGTTWHVLPQVPATGGASSLAILPADPHRLYESFSGGSMFRSRDAGETWERINTGWSHPVVNKVLVHASDPPVLYAALGSSSPRMGGFFRSIDGGDSWQDAGAGLPNAEIWSIVIDPVNPRRIYAGTMTGVYVLDQLKLPPARTAAPPSSAPPAALVVTPPHQIAGPRWQYLGLEGPWVVRAIAVDPGRSSTLYVAASDERAEHGGLFKSIDAGENWRSLPIGPVQFLMLDPQAPSTLYAAALSRGLQRSTDGGETWRDAADGLGDSRFLLVADLVVGPARPSILYALAMPFVDAPDAPRLKIGVFSRTNTAPKWRLAGEAPPEIARLFAHPRRPGVLLALASYDKVYRSTDGAASWKMVPVRDASRFNLIAFGAGNTAYAAGFGLASRSEGIVIMPDNVIARSDDAGLTWRAVAHWPPDRGVWALLPDPHQSARLLAGVRGGGVFQSVDGGATWKPLNEGLVNRFVNAFALDPSNPSTVYAGTDGGGVFVLNQLAAH